MRIFWSLAFIALFVASGSLLAFPQQDVSEFEKRLVKINEEIRDLKAKIREEEKKETGILATLDKIGFNKKLILNELSLHQLQMDKAARELESLKKTTVVLRGKLDRERQSIERILSTLYKFGEFGFIQFLLQADDINAIFAESKHLTVLARYQENIIRDYLKTLNDLKTADEALIVKRTELSQLILSSSQKKQELETQEKENRVLIQSIIKNKKTYEQTLAELSERAEQLQNLMNKLSSQEIVLPVQFVPLYERKGRLPWPLQGKIITPFGLERHPQFNTVTMNNGIELAPQKDNLIIQSVHSGRVVYSDYFQGYGNLLIVDHGMAYYTLYGHCSDFLVRKGDLVAPEQPVAVVGDTGSLKGPSLYFEIRYKAKPLNPLQWLKRR